VWRIKPERPLAEVQWAGQGQKPWLGCEGRKSLMSMTHNERTVDAVFTSYPTGWGRELRRCRNAVALAFTEHGSRTRLWRQIAHVLVPGQIARNRPAAKPTSGVVITEMSMYEEILQSLRTVAVDAASVASLQTRQTQPRCGRNRWAEPECVRSESGGGAVMPVI